MNNIYTGFRMPVPALVDTTIPLMKSGVHSCPMGEPSKPTTLYTSLYMHADMRMMQGYMRTVHSLRDAPMADARASVDSFSGYYEGSCDTATTRKRIYYIGRDFIRIYSAPCDEDLFYHDNERNTPQLMYVYRRRMHV